MNNDNPLVPQGSFLEQKNKGRARVRIAVFFVLAVHGLGLLALLMQGCNKPPETTQSAAEQATNPPPFEAPTNAAPEAGSNAAPATAATQVPAPAPVPAPEVAPGAPGVGATDYKVVKGDSYSTIAKKFHVTIKAIADANPGVEPTKLQIGQTLHIPAPAAPAPTAATTSSAALPTEAAGGEQVYTVVSGDSLIKIAGHFGTTVKALRSANDLTTDKIKVGQKLKIPVKTAAAPAVPAAPAPAPEPTAPAGTSAPVAAPPGR